MPILKIDILGSKIEINYDKNEYDKLIYLIKNFKNRLKEFPNSGKIANSSIILLAALKAEDQLEEVKKLLDTFKVDKDDIKEKERTIQKLSSEIINLKDLLKKENSINLIKLDYDNLVCTDYNKLFTSFIFWTLFKGEKLLIYQEDTMLFHNNIKPFLKYDYVGAPWPVYHQINKNNVGNGGFSLRTKSVMIDCIKACNPHFFKINEQVQEYMKKKELQFIPEDVFFSSTIHEFNLGKVAPKNIATNFSQETIKGMNPLGGHKFWLADKNIDKCYVI